MTLDPRDIKDKKFTEVRFVAGYDQDEVDNFLDECEATVAELQAQLAAVEARLAQASTGANLVGIEKLLTLAQQQADQAVAQGNHDAATAVAEAQRKAEEIVGRASVEAARLAAEAQQQADTIKYRAAITRDETLAHAAELGRQRDAVAEQLRAALGNLTETTVLPVVKEES